ncbi:MAG: glycosyltransferase family 4 protein, partial [Bacteroidia bacterium]
ASVITVCTKDLQQQMESLSIKGNYEVVNNMTDLSLFDNSGMNNDNGKFRFLHISTLHDPQKNISGMLRAVKCLSQIRKDFEVVIAGKGNLEPYIRFAAELKIYETVVTFKGEQDQKEVGALMNAADCFFMFSNYENFPFTIVESFASGIPVIATNVGGIAEHLHAEHGMMVEPGNEKALCDAMENMIKFHSNYKKEELREYARKYFSREVVTKTFLKLYEETYVS